ncbi:hypothetical protein O1611_g6152 [Lasiodiplodia mahajangana]|uniref:Uncharacterized protein n=1 Tax=Lasiodiplodia mahajangana TaxID=1108764 RepID=A0ACC2JJ49_9PEZI|nr:hypothetical protein O1611_g6152 [Lasiodiplodia mahajangana]
MDLSTRYRLSGRDGAVETTDVFLVVGSNSYGPQAHTVVVIVIATVCTSVLLVLAVWVYFKYRRVLKRENRPTDLEQGTVEQGPVGEDIPLQDLPPAPDRTSVHQSGNPDFSAASLPNPRPLNEYTTGLSSHPPSQADLTTAQNALESRNQSQENVRATSPAAPHSSSSSSSSSVAPQSNEEEPPQRRRRASTTRADSPRRHGMVLTGDQDLVIYPGRPVIRKRSDLPSLPGIETMPEVLEEVHRNQRKPSTINEESTTPDDTESPGGETGIELGNRPLPSPHDYNQYGVRVGHSLDDEASDDGHGDNAQNYGNDGAGSSFEGGVQGSRGNWHFSYEDETYDPRDPRFDVEGAR